VAKDDMEIVSALRSALADRVGRSRFELWFGESTRLELADGTLTIGVPSPFFQDWIRTNFRLQIENACLAALGTRPLLHFHVDPTLPEPGLPSSVTSSRAAPSASAVALPQVSPLAASSPSAEKPSAADWPASHVRCKFADLDSFVVGRNNRLARTTAQLVVERPGELSPLLIYGPTGIGKTHLLQGIWTAARRSHREMTTVYLTAEQFTTAFLTALRGSGLPSFRQKYRGVGLLILDDLQFLCGKRCTQVELLYTIDALQRDGRQLVFSADRAPADLADLGQELTTRLQGGMVSNIESPEYETRLGIVRQMAGRMELNVPAEVLQFIAARLTNHARELSGALCRLQASSQALGVRITLPMAEEALGELIRHSTRPVRLPDIEKAVCAAFGLDPQSLQSNRKAKRVSQPRMLAMWLARKYTRAALSEIGQYFGRRSHSTVISAQHRVDDWLADGTSLELADHTWNIDDAIHHVERFLQAG
jgi:chromosomal replication initiator protein